MNVIVDNLMVNYRREGSGPQVLMLHGWGDRLETFDGLAHMLDDDFEIIRLDLAGLGQSQPPASAWGLDEYGAYVKSFLKKIDSSPKVIIGHSNGGAIAITAIASGLIKPESLVLLSSAGIRADDQAKKQAWKVIAKTGKIATAFLPGGVRRKLRRRMYGIAGSDILVAPHMEETFKRIVDQDVQAFAREIMVPTLIVNGTNDEATPASYAGRFHSLISNSRLELIDGADHFAHQEFAKEIARYIKDFLR